MELKRNLDKSNAFIFNRKLTQLTLQSISKPITLKNRSEPSKSILKTEERSSKMTFDFSGDHRTDNIVECPLTPNGTWVHVPVEWLSMIGEIIDLINQSIIKNDINILNELQKSHSELYVELSNFVKQNTEEPLKNDLKVDKIVEKMINFTKSNIPENLVEKDDILMLKNWFIPNFSSGFSVAPFTELLDFISSIPNNTLKTLQKTMNPEQENNSIYDNLKIMSLINQAGLGQGENFQEILETTFEHDTPLNEVETDEYDDSDYEEFNEKYLELSVEESEPYADIEIEVKNPPQKIKTTPKINIKSMLFSKKQPKLKKNHVKKLENVKETNNVLEVNETKNVKVNKKTLTESGKNFTNPELNVTEINEIFDGELKCKKKKNKENEVKNVKKNNSDNLVNDKIGQVYNLSDKNGENSINYKNDVNDINDINLKSENNFSKESSNGSRSRLKKSKNRTIIKTIGKRKPKKPVKQIIKVPSKTLSKESNKSTKNIQKMYLIRRPLTTQKDCTSLFSRQSFNVVPLRRFTKCSSEVNTVKNKRYHVKFEKRKIDYEKHNDDDNEFIKIEKSLDKKVVLVPNNLKQQKYSHLYKPKIIRFLTTKVVPCKIYSSKLNINSINENLLTIKIPLKYRRKHAVESENVHYSGISF